VYRGRKTATIVGVLFVVATLFFIIGQSVYNPILGSPNYLDDAYPHRATVTAGILLELVGVLAIPLIPAFLFPVLRRHNEALALGYAGFRLVEAVLLIMVEIGMLSLVNVSQGYLTAEGQIAAHFQAMGGAIQSASHWAFLLSVSVFFPMGALMLYSALYRSSLVPRFISLWGLIAAAFLLAGSVLNMFDVLTAIPESALELVLTTPIAVNEMVLAIWLIVKGFTPSASAPKPERQM